MGTAIQTVPTPLTSDQAAAMAQQQIKKHHVAISCCTGSTPTTWLPRTGHRRGADRLAVLPVCPQSGTCR